LLKRFYMDAGETARFLEERAAKRREAQLKHDLAKEAEFLSRTPSDWDKVFPTTTGAMLQERLQRKPGHVPMPKNFSWLGGLFVGVGIFLAILYGLVRFVKWAWSN
jgi:hypothetical protein